MKVSITTMTNKSLVMRVIHEQCTGGTHIFVEWIHNYPFLATKKKTCIDFLYYSKHTHAESECPLKIYLTIYSGFIVEKHKHVLNGICYRDIVVFTTPSKYEQKKENKWKWQRQLASFSMAADIMFRKAYTNGDHCMSYILNVVMTTNVAVAARLLARQPTLISILQIQLRRLIGYKH